MINDEKRVWMKEQQIVPIPEELYAAHQGRINRFKFFKILPDGFIMFYSQEYIASTDMNKLQSNMNASNLTHKFKTRLSIFMRRTCQKCRTIEGTQK